MAACSQPEEAPSFRQVGASPEADRPTEQVSADAAAKEPAPSTASDEALPQDSLLFVRHPNETKNDGSSTPLVEVDGVGHLESGTVTSIQGIDVVAAKADNLSAETSALVVGDGLSVHVQGEFEGQFLLTLEMPPAPFDDAIPGVIHVQDDGSFMVESGLWDPQTNTISVWVDSFSDRYGAWWDPRNWVEETAQAAGVVWDVTGDALIDYWTGRNDRPDCRWDQPSGVDFATDELSSLHVCLQSTLGGSEDEFEVLLKSNRKTAQLVTIPSGIDYLWVEGQPEWLREFLAVAVHGATDVVVLPGGSKMTFGLTRTDVDREIELSSFLNPELVISNPIAGALDVKLSDADGTLTYALASQSCIQSASGVDFLRLDTSISDVENLGDQLLPVNECVFELLQNPELLGDLLDTAGQSFGLPTAQTEGFVDRVAKHAEKLKKFDLAGKGVGVVTNFWDNIFDNIAEGHLSVTIDGIDRSWADKIVEEPDGTAWYIDNNLVRKWIPNGGTYNCLASWKAKTIATKTAPKPEINRLTRGNDQTCQPTEARNKIIRKANSEAFYIDNQLVAHPIPDGGTYECLTQVEGKQIINNITDRHVESFATGSNATCAPLRSEWADKIVKEADGTSWYITNALERRWIPNGGTFNCLVAWKSKAIATENASQPEIDRLTRGNDQTCQPTEARNKIIESGGDSYYVDNSLRLRHIRTTGTFQCLHALKGIDVVRNLSARHIESFVGASAMTCQALVVGPDGTAYHVRDSGTRHWVENGGVFQCIEDRIGKQNVFRFSNWNTINLFEDINGDHAKC